jgi:hypothetical protein
MIKKHSFVLASYPRSGTNYFEKAWRQKTGKSITVFRDPKRIQSVTEIERLEVISTIKKPMSSIVSRTMIYFHEDPGQPMKDTIKQSVIDYENTYTSIINGSDHIIDVSCFDNLDIIIDKITGKTNKKIDSSTINSELESMESYSRTFIEHEEYENIKGWVSEHDLSRCEELYLQAYELSRYK